ncbi:uncharacterized protein LOC143173997 isoform X1 [Aptenodytes patagonicus]|uniref:uncharacterized protein LOC143173997 isoform X1 n=1 Tax=Aptenodytes patagonicus TaxID=9234 RepID=UPI003FA11470
MDPAVDPEALVQCPYDKSHQVRVSRLPYHLVKCQRNNPQVARTLATCPFNARHRVPQAKLRSHVASCPDKRQPDLPHETDMSLGDRMKQSEVPTAWQGPQCQEDWEAELEDLEDPPPFILNIRTNDLLLPCDSSAPAPPVSRGRDGGAAGHPAASAEQRAQEGPRTVAAGPGRCPFCPQDWGDRGARGGSAPSAAAAGGDCTHSVSPGPRCPAVPLTPSMTTPKLGLWRWQRRRGQPGPPGATKPAKAGCFRGPPRSPRRAGRAVSCAPRTVPITALQHLPGVFARRVDPAGDETSHVPPPSHGSRSPGDPCRDAPLPPPVRAGVTSATWRCGALVGIPRSRRGLALATRSGTNPAPEQAPPGLRPQRLWQPGSAGRAGLVKAGN